MLFLKQQIDNQLEKTKSDYCDTFYKNQNSLKINESSLIEIPELNLIYETEIAKGKRAIMKDEINAAVTFLIRIISGSNSQLTKQQTDDLQEKITLSLTNKFHNHWHPDKPTKGQAFRCIRVNSKSRNDSILESACQSAGLSYEDLKMPIELTLWIDPEEVACRFGEHKGSYCLLAKFKGGESKENYMDDINISEMDQKIIERHRQQTYEIINRKKKYNKNGFKQNNSTLTSIHVNNNNNVNGYDVSTANSASNYYQFYGSSPNTKYYSTSPPQMQQTSSSNGLYSPNRMSPYRNNASSYMNVSKSMIRNLRTSFDSIGAGLPSTYQSEDRFHWMNKNPIVKA